MVSLRRANENDIPEMANLWAALVMEENRLASPDIGKWSVIQQRMFELDGYYAFVVEDGGKLVGFNNGLALTDIETGMPYIDGGNFYVLPEYRNGISGKLLHRNTFNVAKKLGARFLRRKVSAHNKRMMDRLNSKLGKSHFIKEYIVDEMIGGRQ